MSALNELALNELHDKAMDLTFFALRERSQGNEKKALPLFQQALELELAAIDALEEYMEPTYSVLHRSAATLALDCNELRKAEQLAAKALAKEPPDFVADELREVLEQVYSKWNKSSSKKEATDLNR